MPIYDETTYLMVGIPGPSAKTYHYDLSEATLTRQREGGDVLLELLFERDFRDLRGIDAHHRAEFYYRGERVFRGTRIRRRSENGQLKVEYESYPGRLVFNAAVERQQIPYPVEDEGELKWVDPWKGMLGSCEHGEGLLNDPTSLSRLVWRLLEPVRSKYASLFPETLAYWTIAPGFFYRFESDSEIAVGELLQKLCRLCGAVSWGFLGDAVFHLREAKYAAGGLPHYTYRTTTRTAPFIREGSLSEVEESGAGTLVNSVLLRGAWRPETGEPFTQFVEDAESIAEYGRRHQVVDANGIADALTAQNILSRYLELHSEPYVAHEFTVDGLTWSQVPKPYERIALQTGAETLSTEPIETMRIHFGETISVDFVMGYEAPSISDLIDQSTVNRFNRVQRPTDGSKATQLHGEIGLYQVTAVHTDEEGDRTYDVKRLDSQNSIAYEDPFYEHTFLNVAVPAGHSPALALDQIVLAWIGCEAGDRSKLTIQILNNVTLDT